VARKLTQQVRREERRRNVARLYLRGHSIGQISEVLTVHHKTVHKDLTFVRAAWREQAIASVQDHVNRELAKIDHIETEAWDAWEASKKPEEVTTIENSESKIVPGENQTGSTKVSRRTSNRALPSAEYMATIRWCVEQRCKLLNLYPGGRPVGGGDGDQGDGTFSVDMVRLRATFSSVSTEEAKALESMYAKLGFKKPSEEDDVVDAIPNEEGPDGR
jgi:hypothetical protein